MRPRVLSEPKAAVLSVCRVKCPIGQSYSEVLRETLILKRDDLGQKRVKVNRTIR